MGEGGGSDVHRDEALDREGGGAGGEAERHDGGVQPPHLGPAQCLGGSGLQGKYIPTIYRNSSTLSLDKKMNLQ